jgi:acetyl esterase/lipase
VPIGYLIETGMMATLALSAVARHRPRRSSPFRLSHAFGFVLNWPLAAFVLLAASTVLAVVQSGAGSPVFGIGFGLAVLASGGLVVLRRRARETGPTLEHALDEGLGAHWRDGVAAQLAARLRRRPSLLHVLLAPLSSRRRVERVANVRYGPARRGNLLDVYRDRSGRSGRPTLVYLHAGAFRFGSKRFGARHLFHRLAAHGWVCVSANYRLLPSAGLADPLIDVKTVIAWLREHGREYGADPSKLFLAGSSAGGHLASLAAFDGADTPVAGVVSLYGYYGPVAADGPPTSRLAYSTTSAPPCFVAHGDQDTLVIVEDARAFVGQLRATSSNAVVYAELPGAQHGFDLFRSRRFESVVDAIEAFAACVSSARERPRARTLVDHAASAR